MTSILSQVKIGLGVGGIGEGKEAGVFSNEDYVRTIHEAYDIGYRFFDTAEAYADGRSESLLGAALSGSRSDAIVATKVSPHNLSSKSMQNAAKNSLRRIATEAIDLYQVHWPNPEIPVGEVADGLSKLFQAGHIRAVGVCNYSARQAKELMLEIPHIPFISSQVELSMVDQYPLGRVHDWAQKEGVATLAYSPLGKGRIAHLKPLDELLGLLANEFGATKAQVSLSWLASLGAVLPIPASRNAQHLKENFDFSSINLSEEASKRISGLLVGEKLMSVPPSQIEVAVDGEGSRAVYTTLKQAQENPLDFCPSPQALSMEIILDRDIKPVRIQRRQSGLFLVEGRVRFWSWVIAFGFDEPIPCVILDDVVA
jgi:diketogulonate reductase-like aldo/keto reductase